MGNTSYDRTMKDVDTLSVDPRHTTVCVPPKGEECVLATGTSEQFTASQAKRHAMRHPGHVVIHRVLWETAYVYTPQRHESSNGRRSNTK